MEKKIINEEAFDENQSLKVITEMIQVSQRKLKNDGILFILWGWVMFIKYMVDYIMRTTFWLNEYRLSLRYFGISLTIMTIVFTILYIIKKRRIVKTYIGVTLRYVWISMIVSLSLTNMIIFNVNNSVNFELQNPIFMVFIALATVISGGVLKSRLLVAGGIIFGIAAYICSYLDLNNQMLVEAIAWLVAFVVPGYMLYSARNK